jgi:hypothetical protein
MTSIALRRSFEASSLFKDLIHKKVMAKHVTGLANDSEEWKQGNDSVHTFWPVPFSSDQVARHQTQTWQEVQQVNPFRVSIAAVPKE